MDIKNNAKFPYEVRINIDGLRRYRGYSDLITTFCCSSQPFYYVVFPAMGYEGYFSKYDVEVKSYDKNV